MAKESLPNSRFNYKSNPYTGKQYERLTVLGSDVDDARRWICECVCGTLKSITSYSIRASKTKSCGCHRAEVTKKSKTIHGLYGSPEYKTWAGMIRRCHNARDKNYAEYGMRGVTVCPRWRQSFACFIADMGKKPSPTHSIDRVDGMKSYEPGNCRWATSKEQSNNLKSNRILTLHEESHTVAEWSEITGIDSSSIRARLDVLCWSVEKSLTEPIRGTGGY